MNSCCLRFISCFLADTLGSSSFIASATPFPSSGGSLSGILTPNGYDPNAPSASLQSYNLTVERDLGKGNRLCNGTLSNRTITEWFDPSCFAIPASGFGNSGRNILSGPDSVTVNLALGRVFSMGEYGHFELRWETFGTLNHPSFGCPSSTIGTAATAGVINSTNGGNRVMQFSGRYEF